MNSKNFWKMWRIARILGKNFDARFYLNQNPDVAKAGVNPLHHYVNFGWREGRNPSPSFDTKYYLASNPDVARSNINPLLHYVKYGRKEGRLTIDSSFSNSTCKKTDANSDKISNEDVIRPYFDKEFYIKTYSDVQDAGLDPLRHFVEAGWREGRQPSEDFHTDFYLRTNPDVALSGVNPFEHYILIGRFEGRKASSKMLDLLAQKPARQPWVPSGNFQSTLAMSVIIPTYNRAGMLPDLLESWREVHQNTLHSYELIFSDDGSTDDTVEVLERCSKDLPIIILRNEHGGASRARNAAVGCARGEKILFLGDDIYPDPQIINLHLKKLRELEKTDAVLGECGWHPALNVNHLMKHITEIGCEQFSFLHLPRYEFTDFRHFYTCNISVDREFLLSESTIFDERFDKYGFEDIELGYRLALKGMKIYYLPDAWGDHLHSYNDVRKFCLRQESAGEMAYVFEDLHPEVADIIPVEKWREAWRSRLAAANSRNFDFYGLFVAIVQACEDQTNLHGPLFLERLSRLYAKLFSFAFEVGYARRAFPSLSEPIVQAGFVSLVLDQPTVEDLRTLQGELAFDLIDVLLRELEVSDRQSKILLQSDKPIGLCSNYLSDYSGLVVQAEDLVHINQLQSIYKEAKFPIFYALPSEIPIDAIVYRPSRDFCLNLCNLQQLQLFVELNPHIDQIVLSFGLHDLPFVGVPDDGRLAVLRRGTSTRFGKIIRIFGEKGGNPKRFHEFLDADACLIDDYGYFTGKVHEQC